MNITFNQTSGEGLNNYLFVKQTATDHRTTQYYKHLHYYLSLAKKLMSGLNCYVLIRYSPFLAEVLPVIYTTDWHYNLQSDDFQGLGTDLGFSLSHRLSNGNVVKEQSVYFPLKDLLTLQSFPEDTFGDTSSSITIFALKSGSEQDLHSFLGTKRIPYLPELLLESELFIHILCGKCSGFYDTISIKSVQSIAHNINVINRNEL
ncbi:hypothetical protein DIU31_027510 [Mucilaginibacter rubeus]|uniref:Uncharacterized protein n=1 Tax=Mucilaginibacter rubeus TaxID=2027860 RepID=A0AAE6MLD1_9SPHI|nr:hypothetical protein [Mucilaginibacter rubeus]QEM07072.1 hypothetical protein DIU31_027510 [Mucilaginibacter rubeus]QTE43785.1 hypothetical protein J3L19_33565 [Mucilaginibacter rubeus]QTE50385.1 hypothetical protein J3L21_33520 [Mucilaginibacter rubeus]QTE55472.1 hypothetical protein J3L23_25135 [Mucilaginibacter rubeus]QTE65066.1 hypothetical protein J3L22_08685 [Mucilaginibacter rubeus]